MATLKISRSNEHINRLRDIKLFLNNTEIGPISNSSIKEFPIELGRYSLFAKIDWCASNKVDFEVGADETILFDLMSFTKGKHPNALSTLYYVFFKPNNFLILQKVGV